MSVHSTRVGPPTHQHKQSHSVNLNNNIPSVSERRYAKITFASYHRRPRRRTASVEQEGGECGWLLAPVACVGLARELHLVICLVGDI